MWLFLGGNVEKELLTFFKQKIKKKNLDVDKKIFSLKNKKND